MSGVLGFYNVKDASQAMYYGLHALQHRGQEGTGIVSSDGSVLYGHKNLGTVQQVYTLPVLEQLKGNHAIGHVLYPYRQRQSIQNVQPFLFNHTLGDFAVCSHGEVVNAKSIRTYLEKNGSIFQSESDSEILAHLVNQHQHLKKEAAFKEALIQLEGGFSFLYMTKDALYAIRDRFGLAPLSLGKYQEGYIVSSETCVFDTLGAEFIREINPGELLEISESGIVSHQFAQVSDLQINAMEFVYYSRPDSVINHVNVHQARKQTGIELAKEAFVDADVVFGVPDSSVSAAYGFAQQSRISYELGIIKNRYIQRKLPASKAKTRNLKIKYSPLASVIKGKRVVLVDDSLIKGDTAKELVKMLWEVGAKEVHVRIASPEMIAPFLYGFDKYDPAQLISRSKNCEQLRQHLGATSLAFLSVDGLKRGIGIDNLYVGCFNEVFPTHIYEAWK